MCETSSLGGVAVPGGKFTQSCKPTSLQIQLFCKCKGCSNILPKDTLACCRYTDSTLACSIISWATHTWRFSIFFHLLFCCIPQNAITSKPGSAHHYKGFWIGWLLLHSDSTQQPLLPKTFFWCSESLFILSGNKLSTGRRHFKPQCHTSLLDWKTALQTRRSPKACCHSNTAAWH